MSGFPSYLPSCFDRAIDVGVGTPGANDGGIGVGNGGIGINYAGGNKIGPQGYIPIFEEYSDSPQIESGEQSTIVHKFHCDYYTAQLILLSNPRGTILTDTYGYVTRVLTVRVDPIAKTNGQECNLTMTSEAMSFGTPPDEFDVEVVELNPAAEKHARYSPLTYRMRQIVDNAVVVDDPNFQQSWANTLNTLTQLTPPATALQQAAANELLCKKVKQEDTFYLAGFKVTWTSYFWAPQVLNPGGYIQNPVTNGGLPYQFWSNNGTNNDTYYNNIFSTATDYNVNMFPNSYAAAYTAEPYGLSWMRQADTMHLQRTWYRLTRTWLGGPIGFWDNEWYNSLNFQYYQKTLDSGSVSLNIPAYSYS